MKAECPNNKDHKQFVTVAHVTEDWVVDENGDFLDVFDGNNCETTHGPDPENIWTCLECGAEAVVK